MKTRLCLAALLLSGCAGLVAAQSLEIRTISQDGYTGKFNYTNTTRPGMMIEIMRSIERLDTALKFTGLSVQAPVKRIEHELEYGRIDVFFGLSKSDSRTAKFVFVETPLYQTAYQLAVRADDTVEIVHLDDINKLGGENIVLVNSSESNLDYLQAQGLSLDASGRDTVINCRKLIAKRGRFYFGSTLSLVEEIKAQNWTTAVKILPAKFLTTNVYALFSSHAPPAMVERVSRAIGVLEKSGELKKIFSRYGELQSLRQTSPLL